MASVYELSYYQSKPLPCDWRMRLFYHGNYLLLYAKMPVFNLAFCVINLHFL